jgi:hypothetical protein
VLLIAPAFFKQTREKKLFPSVKLSTTRKKNSFSFLLTNQQKTSHAANNLKEKQNSKKK